MMASKLYRLVEENVGHFIFWVAWPTFKAECLTCVDYLDLFLFECEPVL